MPDSSTEIRVTCYEIDHDGEGERCNGYTITGVVHERSKMFVALGPNGPCGDLDASECAEWVSGEFDQLEMMDDGFDEDIGCFNHTSRVIEIVGHPAQDKPVRFRVRCTVKREYEAQEIG